MPTEIATRERLISAVITLHHPLDYYFGLFLRAKKTEGLKPRTLNDHESHYRYLQRWLVEHHPTLKHEGLTANTSSTCWLNKSCTPDTRCCKPSHC